MTAPKCFYGYSFKRNVGAVVNLCADCGNDIEKGKQWAAPLAFAVKPCATHYQATNDRRFP